MVTEGQTPASTPPTPGRFVVVEGMDGAGTTTVSAALVEVLKARDLRVRLTAEPTDGPFGVLVRRHLAGEVTLDPHATALAFTADRADHLETTIRPALQRGRWVVSDRYLLSTLAYQGAEGVDRELILAASRAFEVPDVTFVIDASDEVRAQRMSERDTVERYEAPELDAAIRASYEESIALLRERGQRLEVIDGSAPLDDVVAEMLRRLDSDA